MFAIAVVARGGEFETMIPGPSDEPGSTPIATSPSGDGHGIGTMTADCRTCELRPRCISYGWMSPGGIWFENAVILAPKPGCRGFVGRGDEIRSHFLTARSSGVDR